MGLAMPPRVFVGYIYAMEFLPSEKTKVLTSIIMGNDGLVLAVTSFYLLYIDRNCRIFFGLTMIGITIAMVSLFSMPESPEYLVSKARYDEARSVIERIARDNKLTEFDFKSD